MDLAPVRDLFKVTRGTDKTNCTGWTWNAMGGGHYVIARATHQVTEVKQRAIEGFAS